MQRLPDPHLTPQRAPFPSSLTPTVFSERSRGRFEASPRRAAPKGHQSLISHTAPRSATLLHQATSRARGTPAFFRKVFSISSSRFCRSSSRSRARSDTCSGGSSSACFSRYALTQLPREVSLIPSSRATSAIARDVSTTRRAASSRNSGEYVLYFGGNSLVLSS